jgi:hypothetical protein
MPTGRRDWILVAISESDEIGPGKPLPKTTESQACSAMSDGLYSHDQKMFSKFKFFFSVVVSPILWGGGRGARSCPICPMVNPALSPPLACSLLLSVVEFAVHPAVSSILQLTLPFAGNHNQSLVGRAVEISYRWKDHPQSTNCIICMYSN